jgi:hypothetical protein
VTFAGALYHFDMASTKTKGVLKAVPAGPWGYQNWRAFLSGLPEQSAQEHIVFSDAHLTGHYRTSDSPFQLINMIALPDDRVLSRPAAVLRSSIHLDLSTDTISSGLVELSAAYEKSKNEGKKAPSSDVSRFHGGHMQDEIAAIASLALGIRLSAGGLSREFRGDDPRGTPVAYEKGTPRSLISDSRRAVVPNARRTCLLESALLSNYPLVSPDHAIALLRAARSYQEALWVAETDPQLAWLLLVSALETAANSWWLTRDKAEDVSPEAVLTSAMPELVELLKQHNSTTLVADVAEHLAPLVKSREKFVRFVTTFLPPPPAPRPPEHLSLPWSAEAIVLHLNAIYGFRSKALHESTPFPPFLCEAPFPCDPDANGVAPIAEIPWYKVGYSAGGFWSSGGAGITLNTFEYIARVSIQKWWNQLPRVPIDAPANSNN